MHCPWCSNPEGMDINGDYITATVDEIYDEILSCKPMFFDHGGVTFTGGECSLQTKPLLELFDMLNKVGVSTAIETNACTTDFLPLARECDVIILDFKHPLADKLSLIGGNLSLIRENILTIAKEKSLHIRIPLIRDFNDDDAALAGFCSFFGELYTLGAVFDVEILPYHEYGKEKWQKIGREYTVKNGFVCKETLKKFSVAFKNQNIKLIKT